MISRGTLLGRSGLALILLTTNLAAPAGAQTQIPAPSSGTPPVTTFFVRDWTRMEGWSFFEPAAGGDPTYAFIANRLQFGLERRTTRYDISGALQYVQFGGLPRNATGPGPLGTGSLYFDQGGRSSRQLYLRYLNVTLKDLAPGWSVRAGRMAYTSGAESPSGDAKVEAVKRQRVDSRLLGEFEWSLYQRSFDGVRTDVDRPRWHATAAVLRPTQGGFEDAAGVQIRAIDVYSGTLTTKPGGLLPHTDWQAFAIRYNDDRDVRGRPDNTGRAASRVDARISTFGTTIVGAYPLTPSRQLDALFWVAAQRGDWFDQEHRAWAVAAEGGIQWTAALWRPWVRGGLNRASGDTDPQDDEHGTFFQLLPTARKYSLSATYSLMNLTDVFVQLLATPRPAVSLRVDAHRVTLASSADRWYFGSGAGQASGSVFGYGARSSQGGTGLGTVIEGSLDYRLGRHWSVNGYVGAMRGGDVVTRTFAGRTLIFAYWENVLQF